MSLIEKYAQDGITKQKAKAFDDMQRRAQDDGLARDVYNKGYTQAKTDWQRQQVLDQMALDELNKQQQFAGYINTTAPEAPPAGIDPAGLTYEQAKAMGLI